MAPLGGTQVGGGGRVANKQFITCQRRDVSMKQNRESRLTFVTRSLALYHDCHHPFTGSVPRLPSPVHWLCTTTTITGSFAQYHGYRPSLGAKAITSPPTARGPPFAYQPVTSDHDYLSSTYTQQVLTVYVIDSLGSIFTTCSSLQHAPC